jgi:hypothetical protein
VGVAEVVGASVSQSEMGVVVEEGVVVRWLRLVAGTVVGRALWQLVAASGGACDVFLVCG